MTVSSVVLLVGGASITSPSSSDSSSSLSDCDEAEDEVELDSESDDVEDDSASTDTESFDFLRLFFLEACFFHFFLLEWGPCASKSYITTSNKWLTNSIRLLLTRLSRCLSNI